MKRMLWDLLRRAFHRQLCEDVDRVLLVAHRKHVIDGYQLHELDAALKYGSEPFSKDARATMDPVAPAPLPWGYGVRPTTPRPSFPVALACLLALLSVPAMAADPPPASVVVDTYAGSEVLITRGERREYVTARATVTAPLFSGLSAFARGDLAGSQDAGGLDVGDFDTFRRIELAAGLGYDVGTVRFVGLGGMTFSAEGTEGAPRDPRMYTMAALTRIGVGEHGYAYAGGGYHGPVGGWALLGALSVPSGPAFATIDYAFPLSQTALQERAWVLRIGAQVGVKRFVLRKR